MNKDSCNRDPIREVQIVPTAKDPLALTVTIQLADHVAACCVNPDSAFVELQGPQGHTRAGFEFGEGRPGHRYWATLKVPATGRYVYRIVAKIMGRDLTREGTYNIPKV